MRFRNEEKEGARIFGRGTTAGAASASSNSRPSRSTRHTRQLDACSTTPARSSSSRAATTARCTTTRYSQLDIAGGVPALATPARRRSRRSRCRRTTTRTSSISRAATDSRRPRAQLQGGVRGRAQDDTFDPPAPRPATQPRRQGRHDAAAGGLVSRPMPKLTLRANYRYEDRDDKTPVLHYFTGTTGSTTTGDNEPRSIRTEKGSPKRAYSSRRIPPHRRHRRRERNATRPPFASSAMPRNRRGDVPGRAEALDLRDAHGRAAYVYSDRDGSASRPPRRSVARRAAT